MSGLTKLHRSRNAGALFVDHADSGRIALIDLSQEGQVREFTYAALNDGCDAVANGLRARGFAKGDRVAIMSSNRAEYYTAFFGSMRAGCVPLQINLKLQPETLQQVLALADAKLVFHDATGEAKVPSGLPRVSLDTQAWGEFQRPGVFEAFTPGPDDLAFQPYTSGTTGLPKGILLRHANVLRTYRMLAPDYAPRDPGIRSILAQPIYHKNGMIGSKSVFLNGGTVILQSRFDVDEYLGAAERYQCTNLKTVPTMMAMIMARQDLLTRHDLSSVRMIGMSSAPVSERLFDDIAAAFPHARVRNNYGCTEAGAVVFGDHPHGKPVPKLSIGYPLSDTEVKLVGGSSSDEGILYVRNLGIMAGYHRAPAQTAARLSDGWFNTGDVLRRDADGFYYFVGRDDDMFVCGGMNLYPATVEQTMLRHPDIQQCSVIAVEDSIKGMVPWAFVVLRHGTTRSEEELKSFALNTAPAYQHPRRILTLDTIPLAGTNKVDLRELKRLASAVKG